VRIVGVAAFAGQFRPLPSRLTRLLLTTHPRGAAEPRDRLVDPSTPERSPSLGQEGRGSLVSLLRWEGHSLTYVAEQAGHSVATLASHHAGVLKELRGQPKTPAAEAIRRARESTSGQLRLLER
jgi:hypothetical protein